MVCSEQMVYFKCIVLQSEATNNNVAEFKCLESSSLVIYGMLVLP